MKKQIEKVSSVFGKSLAKTLLKEDYVGTPLVIDKIYLTSHNRVHHTYHLARYQEATGVKIRSVKSVVEWGGGYGDMARILGRFRPDLTYIGIDTPLFICLQWLYLSAVCGPNKVNLILSPKEKVKKGKFNLVPVGLVDKIILSGDLFLSTWALSECSPYSQKFVAQKKKWFSAKHLLLGYQTSCDAFRNAEKVGKYASLSGANQEEFSLVSGNYYSFK